MRSPIESRLWAGFGAALVLLILLAAVEQSVAAATGLNTTPRQLQEMIVR